MAVSALEMACWDLYGKVTEKPLWKLLGEEFDRMSRVATAFEGEDVAVGSACPGDRRGATRKVYSGAVVGLGTPAQTVAEVRECVDAGYQRVKLKVAPGRGLPAVRAVRRRSRICLLPWTRTRASGCTTWPSCAPTTSWTSAGSKSR